MNKRKWLESLTTEEFARQVIRKVENLLSEAYCSELEAMEIATMTQLNMEQWLESNHKKKQKKRGKK